MSSQLKPTPSFASEADERAFWESHDSTEHVDWSNAEAVRLPNLKPSTRFGGLVPGRYRARLVTVAIGVSEDGIKRAASS